MSTDANPSNNPAPTAFPGSDESDDTRNSSGDFAFQPASDLRSGDEENEDNGSDNEQNAVREEKVSDNVEMGSAVESDYEHAEHGRRPLKTIFITAGWWTPGDDDTLYTHGSPHTDHNEVRIDSSPLSERNEHPTENDTSSASVATTDRDDSTFASTHAIASSSLSDNSIRRTWQTIHWNAFKRKWRKDKEMLCAKFLLSELTTMDTPEQEVKLDCMKSLYRALKQQQKEKLEENAQKWLKEAKNDANKMSEAHSTLAVVGTLVFGISVTSFFRSSDIWYDLAERQENKQTMVYSIIISLACIFATWGTFAAIIRSWRLKHAIITNPMELGKLVSGSKSFVIFVHACIWTALVLFLIGLAVASLGIHDEGIALAIFFLFLVAASLILFYLLKLVIAFTLKVLKDDSIDDAMYGDPKPKRLFLQPWFLGILLFLLYLVAMIVILVLHRRGTLNFLCRWEWVERTFDDTWCPA